MGKLKNSLICLFMVLAGSISAMHRIIPRLESAKSGFARNFYRAPVHHSYSILGVKPAASLEDVKKNYRQLVLKMHPDQGGSREDFEKIYEALSYIKEEKKRASMAWRYPYSIMFGAMKEWRFFNKKDLEKFNTWRKTADSKERAKFYGAFAADRCARTAFWIAVMKIFSGNIPSSPFGEISQGDPICKSSEQILKNEQAPSQFFDFSKTILIAGAVKILLFLLEKYKKPSFEDLMRWYVYQKKEDKIIDNKVVVEQLYEALKKHGYDSKQDEERARKVLIDAGFVLS